MRDHNPTVTHPSRAPVTCKFSRSGFKMSCWNCRGLSSSAPYLNYLLEKGTKILVLSEHWLWPYDLHKLDEINDKYEAVRKSDSRLTDVVDTGRGYGGIGLLWHKNIATTPISGINSDRISSIRFTVDDGDRSMMSVIGVYLSCRTRLWTAAADHLVEFE